MTHARPHLTTHGRAKGHSAIGGVAYRLGLKLYDKRTGEWHDYRRRVLNEEIIAAFTLAPAGAPSWATDAATVWEAVEAAELRKDSQVAHDFRIPVPFGLSGAEAEAMARSMAQHIVETWATVVSVGLHRDSPVDVLGQPKPFGKQGFHAHLYFPTRALAFDADAVRDADEDGQGGSDGWPWSDNPTPAVIRRCSQRSAGHGWARRAVRVADFDRQSATRYIAAVKSLVQSERRRMFDRKMRKAGLREARTARRL
ncbi:MobA/MobL family protein [Luteibacter sp. ME-Dv--P-043b]|uniref:MobA/MobL family protein n=1 Tax=Luteibacter sp. ME-Dv--P-043b TaxID=3040291 RepID=UPI0025539AE0|nr:MobA/MobL family protein [Luteibacter sp. ME-Dv--P-043b]